MSNNEPNNGWISVDKEFLSIYYEFIPIIIYGYDSIQQQKRLLICHCIQLADGSPYWINDEDGKMIKPDEFKITHWKPLLLPFS